MPLPLILTGLAIAGPLAFSAGRSVIGSLARRRGAVVAGGVVAGAAGLGASQLPGLLGGGDPPVRRRRKRALTSDDMRIALSIASAISKKAAENFILQRTRR